MYVFWAVSQTAQRIFYKKSKRAIHPTGKPAGFLARNYNPVGYSNLLPCVAHKNKKPGNPGKNLAVRVGFEPTDVCGVAGFQDQFLKPLGHLTIKGWGGTEIPPHSKEKKLSITVS